MRKLFTFSAILSLLAISLVGVGDAMTQTTTGVQPTSNPTTTVQNTCTNATVTVSQLVWRVDAIPVFLQLLIRSIEPNESVAFEYEGDESITSVQVVGVVVVSGRSTPFDLTVEANSSAQTDCVFVSLNTGGQTTPETPQSGTAQLPTELQGFESLTPDQAIASLQGRGFNTDVQGSQASPKLGDVSDPLLLGALDAGFSARAIWVSAPGQLRASALYDQPNANLVLMVFGGGFCASLSPTYVGLSGLSVDCDRPAIMAPFTTIGGGPVPGFVFLVLLVKIGGPALPYVLSLSS